MSLYPYWLEVIEESNLYVQATCDHLSIARAEELKDKGLVVMGFDRENGVLGVILYKAKSLRKVLDDTMRDDYEGF